MTAFATDGGHERVERALEVGGIALDGEDECNVRSVTRATRCEARLPLSRRRTTSRKWRSAARCLGKRGPTTGNSNIAFYAAYVSSEKKRLLEDKPSSRMWREMEEARPRGLNISEGVDSIYFLQAPGPPRTEKGQQRRA